MSLKDALSHVRIIGERLAYENNITLVYFSFLIFGTHPIKLLVESGIENCPKYENDIRIHFPNLRKIMDAKH
jgi:hypothetical protein